MTSTYQFEEASISVLTTTETRLTGIDLTDLKAKYTASVQGIDYWLKEFESQLKTANDRFLKIIEEKRTYFDRLFSEIKKNNKELEQLVNDLQKNRDSKTDYVEKLQKRVFEFSDKFKEKADAVELAKEVLRKEKETQQQKISELEVIQKEKMAQLDQLKKELYEFSVKINERQRENQIFQGKMDTQFSSLQDKEELLIHKQKKEIQNVSQEVRNFQEENKDRQKRRKIVETKKKEIQRNRDNIQNEEENFREATTTILTSWKSRNPPLTSKQENIAQEQHQLEKTIAHYTELVRDLEAKLRQREASSFVEQEELHRRYVGVTETLSIFVERFENATKNFEEIRKKRDQTSTRLVSVRDTVSPVRVILDNVRESLTQKSKNISAVTEELRERTIEGKNLESKIKDLENERTQLYQKTQRSLQEVVPLKREKERLEFDTVEISSQHKKNQKELTKQNGYLEKIQKQTNSIRDQTPPSQAYETIRASLAKLEEKSDSAETNFGKKKSSAEEEIRRFVKEIRTLHEEIEKKKTEFQKIQILLENKEHELKETNHKITILRDNFGQLERNHQTELETTREKITSISQKRENTETTLHEIQSQQTRLRTQHRQYREQQETTSRDLEKVRTESKKIRTDRESSVFLRRKTSEDTRGLTVRVKEVQNEVVDVKMEIERKDGLIMEVREKEKIVRRDVEEYWSQVQEFNSKVSHKTSQIEKLIREILELAPRQKRKLEEAKKEIFILKASINKRTQQHNEAVLKLVDINHSLQVLNVKLDETLNELDLYNVEKEKERFTDVRGKLSIAKKEIEALRSDIEMRTSQYQEKIKLLDISGERLENLTNEKISLNSNLDPIKSECLKLKEEKKILVEEQRKTEIERDNISAELEKLRKEQSHIKIDLQQTEEKLKIETDIAEKAFFQFRTNQSEYEKTKIDLNTAIENLRTSETQIRKLEIHDRTSKQSLEQATYALTTLREDLSHTTAELGNFRNSVISAEEKYYARERNFENLDSERKKTKKEISELQLKVKEVRREVVEGEGEKKEIEENTRDFEKKISAKKEETRNIERRIQELGLEIERYKELLDTTNQQKSSLVNKIDYIDLQDLFQDFSNACEELDHWKTLYHKKSTEYDLLTTKTNTESPTQLFTVEQMNNLRKNISEKSSEEKDLKISGNHLRSELKRNQSEMEYLKKELFSAKSEVEVMTRRYEASRSTLERKEFEKNSLLARIASLSLEVEVLKKEREVEASRAEALSVEASALGTQVDAQLGKIELLQYELQELENLRLEIENLNTTVSTLKSTHRLFQTTPQVPTSTSSETDQLTQTRMELHTQLESLRDGTTSVSVELKELDDSLEALREQRKNDRERIRSMERQERELSVERENLRRLVVELEMQLTELESFRGEFDASVVTRREVKEEYVRIEKEVHEWDGREVEITKEQKEVSQSTRQKYTQLSHQKKTLTTETQTTRTRISTLEHRLESLLTERDAQVARLEALKADLTAIKSERDVNLVWMDTEHRRIQKALGGLHEQLTDRYTDLMDLLSQHQAKYEIVKSQLWDIENERNLKRNNFADLCTRNENTQLELGNMRRKMGHLQTTLEEYKVHIVKAEAKILELEKEVGKFPPKDQNSPIKDNAGMEPEKGNDVHGGNTTEKGTIAGKRAHQDEYMDVDEDTSKFGSGTPSVKKPRLRIRLPPNTPHLHTQVVPQDWAYEGSDPSDRR